MGREHFNPDDGVTTFCVTMTMSATGTAEGQELVDLLEILTRDNVAYFEELRRQGIELPCCAGCAGVRYRVPTQADYEAGAILFKGARDMLDTRYAACGSIAAFDAAIVRVKEGGAAWPEIQAGAGGPSSYHAVVGTPSGPYDPTAKMERV